jgi:hypothetical protein
MYLGEEVTLPKPEQPASQMRQRLRKLLTKVLPI